ncbi:MAG: hypothetical protein J6V53_00180 [Alphaproteobacteria bacterium]|nr:hypothetical protein [Alphaproteobacteria bacterium]
MIFDLYKAHKIMQNPNYGYFGKMIQIRKTGLTYKEVYRFFEIYLKQNPYTPFKKYNPKNEEKE